MVSVWFIYGIYMVSIWYIYIYSIYVVMNDGLYIPIGIQPYFLRKCLGYHLLQLGGLSTFSDSVWIPRDMVSIWLVYG